MPFIEAPTNFYLGRTYHQESRKLGDDVIYYDSRDLTTHAVIVGMTGSGKTGLGISLLEEAALDNIPAIIVDPKGDITNRALVFPELKPDDFQPWIHQADAQRANMDLPTYATDIAQTWRDGLQRWGIVPDRLRWLRGAADLRIYTPGSEAGLPISILASLRAPRQAWPGQEETIREQITGTVSALFALAGMTFQPVRDVEHVLLSNIIETSWRQGRDLTLEDIVRQIQSPPFDKLGVFPLDQAINEKKRYKLAMELNNIIAAPSFQSWLQGEPLDIQTLLYQQNGRPRHSIFYIAHLSDQERMFIMTLILESLIGWMRTLSGTPSLRALLYIDEMFGYFPPYPKNPPTKEPLLRLIKQARAFGLGLILATQNPGDIDYKGLSNAGTWFIGRLSSDNDRKKVMAGLESLASVDDNLDLKDVEQIIADIQPRVFLMRNVHNAEGTTLLHTRWAMSYLAGPLTRQQIGWLMQGPKQQVMAQMAQGYYAQQYNSGGYAQPQAGFQSGYGAPPPPPGATGAYGQPQQANFGAPPPPPGFNNAGGFGQQDNFGAPPPPPGFNNAGGFGQPQQPNFGGGFNAQSAAGSGAFPAQNGGTSTTNDRLPGGFIRAKPPVPSATHEYFLPATLSHQQVITQYEQQTGQRINATSGVSLAYKPVLFAQTSVRYSEKKAQIYTARDYAFHIPDLEARGLIHWEEHQAALVNSRDLTHEAREQAIYQDLPLGLQDEKRLKTLEKELVDFLYNTARLIIPSHPQFKLYGDPDSEISNFQAQVYQRAREERDAEIDQLSETYGKRLDRLEEQFRKKQRELSAEKAEIDDRRQEQFITAAEAGLSLMRGQTNYTLSRVSRANRYREQTQEDIQESEAVLVELQQEMGQLSQEYEYKLNEINSKWAKIANDIQPHTITPYKKDIHVTLFGVGWLPHYYINMGGAPLILSAFA